MYVDATNSWQRVADMPSKRAFAAACALDDVVFVSGGYDGSTYLDTVDSYDMSTNIWQHAPSMTTPRFGHALVALDGSLFAFGGSNGTSYLRTAEQYSAATRKWVEIASMSVARWGVAGCALGVSSAAHCFVANANRAQMCALPDVSRFDFTSRAFTPFGRA